MARDIEKNATSGGTKDILVEPSPASPALGQRLIYKYRRASNGRIITVPHGLKTLKSVIKDPLTVSGGAFSPEKSSRYLDEELFAAEPTEEEAAAVMAALEEAETIARRALSQAKRNTFQLRDARLEIETARSIAAASNRAAASLAGAAE